MSSPTRLRPSHRARIRHIASAAFALTLLTGSLAACAGGEATPDASGSADAGATVMMILGGYKSGMQTLDYNLETGDLTKIAGFEEQNPSFFAWDPVNGYLVVKCEGTEGEGGYIATYRVAGDQLERISTRETGDPSYVTVSPDGAYVVATDYKSGSVYSIPLAEDGTLGEIADVVTHEGSGPYELQTGPHAHSAVFDPQGARFVVADAGNDTVYTYTLDSASGKITEVSRLVLPPGSSPRHAVFAPDTDMLYVDGESSMQTMALSYDTATGALTLEQSATVLSPEDEPKIPKQWWGSSDLTVSADGAHLYVANRGPDTITMFAIGEDGLLTQEQIIPSGGKTPRSLLLSPDGSKLLVANQNSAAVNLFDVAEDGTLSDDGIVAYLNGAAAFTFVP